MGLVNKARRALFEVVAKHEMWVVILFVLVCFGLGFWGLSSVISTTWRSVAATENPIERGLKWIALAITFHAIWNKHEIKVEASK